MVAVVNPTKRVVGRKTTTASSTLVVLVVCAVAAWMMIIDGTATLGRNATNNIGHTRDGTIIGSSASDGPLLELSAGAGGARDTDADYGNESNNGKREFSDREDDGERQPSEETLRRRRHKNRQFWEWKWGKGIPSAPWMDRPLPAELVVAVRDGWFDNGTATAIATDGDGGGGSKNDGATRRKKALDIGCGQGEVAAWLAERGFDTLGVDISRAAINRANGLYPPSRYSSRLHFLAADVCAKPVPTAAGLSWLSSDPYYSVLVDRGCFHQLPHSEHANYGRMVAAVASPDARFLLLVRAFRDDSGERLDEYDKVQREHRRTIDAAMKPHGFHIVKDRLTYLDKFAGKRPDEAKPMPGLCFWLERRPTDGDNDESAAKEP